MHGYATSANSKFAKDKRMLWMWRGSLWGGGSVGLEEFLNFVPASSFLKLFVLYFNCVPHSVWLLGVILQVGVSKEVKSFVPHKMRRRTGTPVHYEVE